MLASIAMVVEIAIWAMAVNDLHDDLATEATHISAEEYSTRFVRVQAFVSEKSMEEQRILPAGYAALPSISR